MEGQAAKGRKAAGFTRAQTYIKDINKCLINHESFEQQGNQNLSFPEDEK
jgi:hypothetical protein